MASLRQSEQQLRLALEAGGMTVWRWDLLERAVLLDFRASILFGYDPMLVVISED